MNKKIRSPRYVIELAKKLRVNMTPGETILWKKLKEKKLDGFKFRKQHPIFRYILDFYCPKKSLAIEIDGDIHKSRIDYDEYRDNFIESLGISTLRFSNKDIKKNIAEVINTIKTKLNE